MGTHTQQTPSLRAIGFHYFRLLKFMSTGFTETLCPVGQNSQSNVMEGVKAWGWAAALFGGAAAMAYAVKRTRDWLALLCSGMDTF